MKREIAAGLAALVTAAGILAGTGVAHAIPTNPDPCHTLNCTPWSNVPNNMLVPGVDAHQHRDAQSLFNVNARYKTYSVWDDRVYRYNAAMDRPLNKAQDMQDFGHGFINRPPRYRFDIAAGTDVPLWARPIITQVIDQWSDAVNELGNNVNMIATETKIQFQQVVQNEEILIRFADKFPVSNGAGGWMDLDFPSPSQIYPDGGAQNPPNPGGGGPQGGRSGVIAYWTPSRRILTFNRKLLMANKWYQDTGNPMMDNNPAVQPNQFDLYTTALHEWGHVLGLDHPVNPMMGTTMHPTQGERNMPNGIIRTIDAGSLDGAKNLYTVARCPPPAGGAGGGGGGGEACPACDSCCPVIEPCPVCPVCMPKP
jgi:hypothetical protein